MQSNDVKSRMELQHTSTVPNGFVLAPVILIVFVFIFVIAFVNVSYCKDVKSRMGLQQTSTVPREG